MRSNYKTAYTISNGTSSRPLLAIIMIFALIMCLFGKANAQRGNQSDWNVPPPLAPGTITKGDAEGRAGSAGVAALTFTDVPAAIQPVAAAGVPELAALTATSPDVNQPQQPEPGEVLAALPEMPVPETPEMPDMPERSMQDAPEPLQVDIPMPAAPDMPPVPPEPVGNTAPKTRNAGTLPLMPQVSAPATFTGPGMGTLLWNTPSLPPAVNFKLIIRTN